MLIKNASSTLSMAFILLFFAKMSTKAYPGIKKESEIAAANWIMPDAPI
jgi:hypothetical protein